MHFSDLASTVVVIALVSFFGLILGKIKIKSFSLGIGGVLFAEELLIGQLNVYGA